MSALCLTAASGDTVKFQTVSEAESFRSERAAERDAWIKQVFGE